MPEKDLWVNLSPYEKDRIIPQSFGLTEMGRDLLGEDYMLKQITASLIYPEGEIGKQFWKRVYEEAAKRYGTTNVSVNTFNKVWIVPEKAVVYENAKAGTAYVLDAKLKVMLEEDYLSLAKHQLKDALLNDTHALGNQIVRDIIIPQLTREVNEDKNFAQLRQVYNSLILATWYKKKIKDSILEEMYADKNEIQGLGPQTGHSPLIGIQKHIEYIYQQYLKAFKKGVFNYIKEEPGFSGNFPRRYFSGGLDFAMALNEKTGTRGIGHLLDETHDAALLAAEDPSHDIVVEVKTVPDTDMAMKSDLPEDLEEVNPILLEDQYKGILWTINHHPDWLRGMDIREVAEDYGDGLTEAQVKFVYKEMGLPIIHSSTSTELTADKEGGTASEQSTDTRREHGQAEPLKVEKSQTQPASKKESDKKSTRKGPEKICKGL